MRILWLTEEFGPDFWASEGVILLVVLLLAACFGLALWLLNAVGVRGMSRTLGIKRPWLAFIPGAHSFALGRVAERSPAAPGRKPMRWSWVLLGLFIARILLSIPSTVMDIYWEAEYLGDWSSWYGSEGLPDTIAALTAGGDEWLYDYSVWDAVYSVTSGLSSIVWIVYQVFYFCALYRVYKLFAPSPTTYLVLSILFGITRPFFLFSMRNKPPVMQYGYYGMPAQPYGYPAYTPYPPQPPYTGQTPPYAPSAPNPQYPQYPETPRCDGPASSDPSEQDPWNK